MKIGQNNPENRPSLGLWTVSKEFHDYIMRNQQKYINVSYSEFLENPIICDNKVVLHFHVHCLTKSGIHRRLDAIAILTIEKGKICVWEEVFQDIQ